MNAPKNVNIITHLTSFKPIAPNTSFTGNLQTVKRPKFRASNNAKSTLHHIRSPRSSPTNGKEEHDLTFGQLHPTSAVRGSPFQPLQSTESTGANTQQFQPPVQQPEPPQAPLRFSLGTKVQCNVGEWKSGTIVQLHYSEAQNINWESGRVVPYQMQLEDGRLIFAPVDDDSVVRKMPTQHIPSKKKNTTKFTSTFRGITKDGASFKAQISILGKRKHLGMYKSEKEAAEKFDRWAIIRGDKKSHLNFPNMVHALTETERKEQNDIATAKEVAAVAKSRATQQKKRRK